MSLHRRPGGAVDRTWSHHAVVSLRLVRLQPILAVLPGHTRAQNLVLSSVSIHSTVVDSRCIQFAILLGVARPPAKTTRVEGTETIRYSNTTHDEYTRPLSELPLAALDVLADEPTWLDRLTTTERKS